MFPHRYCLGTLLEASGENHSKKPALRPELGPELERDKKRIFADHKWLRGKWWLHEVGWANSVMVRGTSQQCLFCFWHDVRELYGCSYLLPNETDKWGGDQVSRGKNSALPCKLRSQYNTERGGVWTPHLLWTCDDLAHAKCSRQACSGVFVISQASD